MELKKYFLLSDQEFLRIIFYQEEYIFAALNLYLDIVQLFMYILMIVGASRGD